MAKRRMVSRRLTDSDKVSLALRHNDRARFVYVALLPFTDRAGRVNVNPNGLKGTIFEAFEYSVAEIEAALHDLARVGLITLYSTPKHTLLAEYVKFTEFNTPHPKEAESDLPSSEDASSTRINPSGNLPEQRPAVAGQGSTRLETSTPTEVPSSEEEVSAEKARDLAEPLAAARPTKGGVRAVDQPFVDAWNENRGRLSRVLKLDKARERNLDRLRSELGDEALELFTDAVRAVAAGEHYARNGYGFGNLISGGKIVNWAEAWRSRPQRTSELASAADFERPPSAAELLGVTN